MILLVLGHDIAPECRAADHRKSRYGFLREVQRPRKLFSGNNCRQISYGRVDQLFFCNILLQAEYRMLQVGKAAANIKRSFLFLVAPAVNADLLQIGALALCQRCVHMRYVVCHYLVCRENICRETPCTKRTALFDPLDLCFQHAQHVPDLIVCIGHSSAVTCSDCLGSTLISSKCDTCNVRKSAADIDALHGGGRVRNALLALH